MELLEMAARDEIQIAVSPAILDETCRVLRDKFDFSEARIAETRALIEACTVHPKARLNVITEDPNDDRILECAVESGSDTIVTGDKDLLRRDVYQDIRIVPVAEFLAIGRERG
jgi:uncharacterized protein